MNRLLVQTRVLFSLYSYIISGKGFLQSTRKTKFSKKQNEHFYFS